MDSGRANGEREMGRESVRGRAWAGGCSQELIEQKLSLLCPIPAASTDPLP